MNHPDSPPPAEPERTPDAAEKAPDRDPAGDPAPRPAPDVQPGPGGMRASDADRDKVADRLREALADGRITAEEHAERIDVVYKAKTYADLEPVLADLPGGTGASATSAASPVGASAQPPAAPPRTEPGTAVAILSEVKRGGRWLVEAETNANVVLGKITLDLRQAVLSQREVTINCACVLGEVEIIVPPGVRVANSASAVLGQTEVPFDDPEAPDAPTVRITGFALLGQIEVRRRAVGEATLSERIKQITEDHVHSRVLGREERRHAVREAHEEHRRLRDERRDHLRALRDERRHGRH
ncbi:DUF1707 SHOCT-like domain-containing protein [Actinomadura oligospora]|uniref:DUF1707 SHOCT-like domain-containing protein n=1 Tax=Actinomadura oligospora TaxID=111804 RepID=UPI0004B373D7|nr:DUF1707 domain-containing protein [Actinomadura oligospora]